MWFLIYLLSSRQISTIKLVQSATSLICFFRNLDKSLYEKIEIKIRFESNQQLYNWSNKIRSITFQHKRISVHWKPKTKTEMSRNVHVARVTRVVIFTTLFPSRAQTVATRCVHVSPILRHTTQINSDVSNGRLDNRVSANVRRVRAWQARQNSGKGKVRVTCSLKLRKLRQRAAAAFMRDYQLFGVEARAMRCDGVRRRRARASPLPTWKPRRSRIPPRSKTRARPSTRPSRSQQNVRLPTGCHEEWQGRVIDSSTIATSWYRTI